MIDQLDSWNRLIQQLGDGGRRMSFGMSDETI